MEVYILDSLYRRVQIVDQFESLIWTERHRAYGDFELHVISNLENKGRFVAGTRLAIKESQRVMTVETVEDVTDPQGKKILKLRGRSLEYILTNRLARGELSNLTDTPKWVLTGTPVAIAEQIFHDICVLGVLDPGDIIPGVIESDAIFPTDTIAEPPDTIVYEIDMMSVYQAIVDLCDVYDIGFRLVRNADTSELYWDVYTGSDRTSHQTTLPAVIFSSDLENLHNTTRIDTIALYKNVAYVISPAGYAVVYPLDVDPSIEGFERRALFVKVDDIEIDDPDATDKMVQRGLEALGKARQFSAFDGELSQYSRYVYGRDYNLGDLVETRSSDGSSNVMQITEQIFVDDSEGERSYPTLAVNTFITPGSWLSMPPELDWDDMTDEEWEDMP